MHAQTWEKNFAHSMMNNQLEDGVSGKIENTFGETIFIGYVTALLLNKYLNIMELFTLFIVWNRNYLGIHLLLLKNRMYDGRC